MIVNMRQAKTRLSKLVEAALAGEEMVIARGSEPVVRLTPLKAPRGKPVFGAYKGRFALADAFFAPLPDDELTPWCGQGG